MKYCHFPGPHCTDSNSAMGTIESFRPTLLPWYTIKSESSWFCTRLLPPAVFQYRIASVLKAWIYPFKCKTENCHPPRFYRHWTTASVQKSSSLSSAMFDTEVTSTDNFFIIRSKSSFYRQDHWFVFRDVLWANVLLNYTGTTISTLAKLHKYKQEQKLDTQFQINN